MSNFSYGCIYSTAGIETANIPRPHPQHGPSKCCHHQLPCPSAHLLSHTHREGNPCTWRPQAFLRHFHPRHLFSEFSTILNSQPFIFFLLWLHSLGLARGALEKQTGGLMISRAFSGTPCVRLEGGWMAGAVGLSCWLSSLGHSPHKQESHANALHAEWGYQGTKPLAQERGGGGNTHCGFQERSSSMGGAIFIRIRPKPKSLSSYGRREAYFDCSISKAFTVGQRINLGPITCCRCVPRGMLPLLHPVSSSHPPRPHPVPKLSDLRSCGMGTLG